MSARSLSDHIAALIERHDSIRAAANAVGIDHAYLHKMRSGEKSHPSPETLRKLGLCPTPLYLPRKP